MTRFDKDFKGWYEEYRRDYVANGGITLMHYDLFVQYPIEFRWGVLQRFLWETRQIEISKAVATKGWLVIGVKMEHFAFKTPEEAEAKAKELYNSK